MKSFDCQVIARTVFYETKWIGLSMIYSVLYYETSNNFYYHFTDSLFVEWLMPNYVTFAMDSDSNSQSINYNFYAVANVILDFEVSLCKLLLTSNDGIENHFKLRRILSLTLSHHNKVIPFISTNLLNMNRIPSSTS